VKTVIEAAGLNKRKYPVGSSQTLGASSQQPREIMERAKKGEKANG
jgi:hypothetical protein